MDIHLVRDVVNVLLMTGMSLEDLLTQKISLWMILLHLSLGAGNLFFIDVKDVFFDAAPGIVFLLIGALSGEKIGYGDGLVVLSLGLYMGLQGLMDCILIGNFFVLAAITIDMIFAQKRSNTNREIPYIPCLFGGLAVSYLL